jgi:hypothetical protein
MKLQDGVPNPATAQWREVVSDGRHATSFNQGRTNPASPEQLDLLNVTLLGEKAGAAKKNWFPTMEGRPYLGLQLSSSDVQMHRGMQHLLDHGRLELLLVSLCWSESTMHAMPDMTASYIEAMTTPAHEQPDAAKDQHWTVTDVERLLHNDAKNNSLALTRWHAAETPQSDSHLSRLEIERDQATLVLGMTSDPGNLESDSARPVEALNAGEDGIAELGDVGPISP